ncbi:metal-sensitive transcriptional regulator [Bacillus sp. FJAT-42315]|uniref:metal-sensitive transcriptional regulator n=1 Tax=Bacillus sp. FJAT-42315 TaxID=2014077 RepID=UPI000C24D74E|nr:metal-sensitive transcriptional regulator [Bacillus sp. FJAT-42315]
MTYDKNVQNRLKRIEGQVRGVLRMMEEEKDCTDIVMQLSAIQGAINRTIGVVVSKNLEQCVRHNVENGEETDEMVKEAVELLMKSR